MRQGHVTHVRINESDAVNLVGRFGVFRVKAVSRDDLGRPVMVLCESESTSRGRFEEWHEASEIENVRAVTRWAEDYCGLHGPACDRDHD